MADKAVICGVTVDRKDYDNFALQEFEVPHDFKEGKRKLLVIEQLAQMSDYKKHYPEFAEACRKIVERERRSIQKFYAQRDGRKEFDVMRHNSFDGYLKDLQEIKKIAAAERAELTAKHNAAAAKWKEAQNDPFLSEFGKTSRKMDWLTADKEYKDGIADLKQRTDAGIKEVRAEFEKHLNDFYGANGSRLDDDVIRLLNSGIKLTEKEMNSLVEKNMNNPTMLRVLDDYCDKSKIQNKIVKTYAILARSDGKHEREIFNQVVDMVDRITGSDEDIAAIWGAENSHFDKLSGQAIEAMSALSVQPEETNYA